MPSAPSGGGGGGGGLWPLPQGFWVTSMAVLASISSQSTYDFVRKQKSYEFGHSIDREPYMSP